MKTKWLVLLALLVMPSLALADSISPASYSDTLAVGESVTITKTVTVDTEVTSAKVDVFFLTDTTGSMGGLISSVKASATSILSTVSGLGDVAFGVGEYKDFTDSYAYRLNTAMTTVAADVQSGINMYSAGGGGDGPEANLYALNEVATSDLTGWRDDSTKIIVWFGDAPSHDPSGGVTEAAATAALISENITVQAINAGYYYEPTDYSYFNSLGQAERIADATGGTLYNTIDTSSIVTEISAAISDVFAEYSKISLGVIGDSGGVDVSFSPASYIGDYDRSIGRDFTFDVTFTGTSSGEFDFAIGAYADDGLIARELDSFTVTGGPAPVPEPATFVLLGAGLLGLGYMQRRRKN